MNPEITAEELKERLSKGESLNFFDVREEWEHQEKNIGGTNFPLYSLPNKHSVLDHLKDSEIIVHCKTGPRGNRARKFLASQGFSNVRNLSGGMEYYLSI